MKTQLHTNEHNSWYPSAPSHRWPMQFFLFSFLNGVWTSKCCRPLLFLLLVFSPPKFVYLPGCLPKQWTLYRCCWEQCWSWGQLSKLSGCRGPAKIDPGLIWKNKRLVDKISCAAAKENWMKKSQNMADWLRKMVLAQHFCTARI